MLYTCEHVDKYGLPTSLHVGIKGPVESTTYCVGMTILPLIYTKNMISD